MKDKTQYEALVEELQKIVENFRDGVIEIGERLSKLLPDIEIPDEEEDAWEMKCPYEYGDTHYCIQPTGEVFSDCWEGIEADNRYFSQGNIFPTEQAAELESKRRNLLTRFRAFRDECNEGWIPSWSDNKEIKAYIQYHEQFNEFVVKYTLNRNILQTFGFFKCKQDAERAIELFGDEIKELFVKKRGGRMETINEIKEDDLVINEQTDSQIYACDLKREWNSLNEDERSVWRTLKERTIKLSTESVLDWIYEYMEQDGYEDMLVHLWNDTSEEFKQRMQGLLDEISNFPSAKVYDIDEGINPFVDLEELMR